MLPVMGIEMSHLADLVLAAPDRVALEVAATFPHSAFTFFAKCSEQFMRVMCAFDHALYLLVSRKPWACMTQTSS